MDVIEANTYDNINSLNLTTMDFTTDKTTSLRDQKQIFAAIDSTVLAPDLDFEINLLDDEWSITNTLIREAFSLFSTKNDCSYIDTTDETDCVSTLFQQALPIKIFAPPGEKRKRKEDSDDDDSDGYVTAEEMECTSFSSRTQTEPSSPENEEILVPIDNVPGFREPPKGQVTSRAALPHEPEVLRHSYRGDKNIVYAGCESGKDTASLVCEPGNREPLKGQVTSRATLPPESEDEGKSVRDGKGREMSRPDLPSEPGISKQ